MDAIIVAADHFKNLGGVHIENKKIILMTNFEVPTVNDHKAVQLVSIINNIHSRNKPTVYY